MKAIGKIAIVAAAMAAFSSTAIANDPMEKAIKARKAQMQLYAWNLGQLGAMAKGAVPYDAAAASAAADNLLAVVSPERNDHVAAGFGQHGDGRQDSGESRGMDDMAGNREEVRSHDRRCDADGCRRWRWTRLAEGCDRRGR